jgi:hypothetical protein
MFAVPAFSLLSAIAVARSLFFCNSPEPRPSRIPFACFRPVLGAEKSGEQRSAKPHESCQALQNEHLQKSSHNPREMNTYKFIRLKAEQNEHLQKSGGPLGLGSDPFAITTDRAMINVP